MLREGSIPIKIVTDSTCDLPEQVQSFLRKIAHLIPPGELYTLDITPIIGVHIGPGAVGFAVVTKRRS